MDKLLHILNNLKQKTLQTCEKCEQKYCKLGEFCFLEIMKLDRVIIKNARIIGKDSSGIGVGSFRTSIDVKFAEITIVPDWYVQYTVISRVNSLSSVS